MFAFLMRDSTSLKRKVELMMKVVSKGMSGRQSGQSPLNRPLLWKKLDSQMGIVTVKRDIDTREKMVLSVCSTTNGRMADLWRRLLC